MGMSLSEVINSVTWHPAQYIKHKELGHLTVGAVADIAVLKLESGKFGFEDIRGKKIEGNQKLQCELTIREGNVVWDLNGISMPTWQKSTGK